MSKTTGTKKSPGKMILSFIAAYIFALGFPLMAKVLLNSNLSAFLIVVLVVIKPTLGILEDLLPKVEKYVPGKIKYVLIILSSVFSFIFAFIITIGILITPANSYRILFKAMQAHVLNPGRVANIFVLFIAFFATTFSCKIIKNDYAGPLLGMGLIISLLSVLIFQSAAIYLVSLIFIIGCFVYLGWRHLDKGNRLSSVVFSIIIVSLCFGVGYGLHRLLGIQRSETIDNLSVSIRGSVSRLFPQIPLIYELPEFGFSFEDEFDKDLGSTPILSNIALFEVEGNPGRRNIYLKTRIHEQFINNNWESPAYNDYMDKQRKRMIGKNYIENSEDKTYVAIPFRTGTESKADDEIGLKLVGEYFNFLPQTLHTLSFRFLYNPPGVVFGDSDQGYYLDNMKMLLYGDMVYLKEGPGVIRKPESFKPYLQIPLSLSPEIKAMAEEYGDILEPRGKIAAIIRDLALHYTYNIDTGTIKRNENFLDNFLLKTKEGYSVHFATALIILARLNNIPARYATGFLAIIPQPPEGPEQAYFEGYKTTIRGFSAHVWPEVWYDDTGWTTEEATPAVNPDFYTVTDKGIIFNKNIILNPKTQEQISSIMGDPVVFEKEFKDSSGETISLNPVYLLFGVLVLVFVFLIIRYAYLIVYLLRKNRKTINMLLRKTIKKHEKKGLPVPAEVGWLEWSRAVKEKSPQSTHLVDSCTHIILDIMYGGSLVRKSDVKTVFKLYRKVKSKK
ncbi:MAG: hypothetical protein JXJ04_10185 [Spirochaetales bacterium]|nr:hypothetical protein [Spirochaetales bacterium]